MSILDAFGKNEKSGLGGRTKGQVDPSSSTYSSLDNSSANMNNQQVSSSSSSSSSLHLLQQQQRTRQSPSQQQPLLGINNTNQPSAFDPDLFGDNSLSRRNQHQQQQPLNQGMHGGGVGGNSGVPYEVGPSANLILQAQRAIATLEKQNDHRSRTMMLQSSSNNETIQSNNNNLMESSFHDLEYNDDENHNINNNHRHQPAQSLQLNYSRPMQIAQNDDLQYQQQQPIPRPRKVHGFGEDDRRAMEDLVSNDDFMEKFNAMSAAIRQQKQNQQQQQQNHGDFLVPVCPSCFHKNVRSQKNVKDSLKPKKGNATKAKTRF